MKKSVRLLALMAVGLVLLSAAGCDKLRARDQLNKGVASYKNGLLDVVFKLRDNTNKGYRSVRVV